MKNIKKLKSHLVIIVFLIISSNLFGQVNKIDTNNVLVKFCTSHNKYPVSNIDIQPHICLYKKVEDNIQTFQVKSYDLLYVNNFGETKIIHNNRAWLNPESKSALVEIKSEADANKYFITNVLIEDVKTKQVVLIKRKTPLVQAYNLEAK